MTQKPSFHIIGISVRTTNQDQQASSDIPALWNKFFGEGILAKIPNKVSSNLYSIYTDYEKDHTAPYTTILGCEVENLNEIPEGLIGKTIPEGNYEMNGPKYGMQLLKEPLLPILNYTMQNRMIQKMPRWIYLSVHDKLDCT